MLAKQGSDSELVVKEIRPLLPFEPTAITCHRLVPFGAIPMTREARDEAEDGDFAV